MELKYKTADVQKMIDVFAEIQNKKEAKDYEGMVNEMVKLIDYPAYIIQEFLNCIDALSKDNHDEENLKKDYWGIIGYIVIRLNIATEDSVKWPAEDM